MGSLVELLLEMDREERLAYVEIEVCMTCLANVIYDKFNVYVDFSHLPVPTFLFVQFDLI